MKLFTKLAGWALLATKLALSASPAAAQAPTGPHRGGVALTDYFLIELAATCEEVTDPAWAADVSRRIKDFVLRTEGSTRGTGRLLGVSEVSLGLLGERIRSKYLPDAPAISSCAGVDWPAIRERGERYRRDPSLDTPMRR